MPPVKPLAPRHYSEDTGSRLVITIPSRKNWLFIPIMGVWLIGWAFGEIMVGGIIISSIFGLRGFDGPPALFLFIWFTFWTIGGAFIIYAFFWQIVGKEEIEVTSYSVTISQVLTMFRRSKEYASEHIKDLRTSPVGMNEIYNNWSRSVAIYGMGNGVIAFDYGAGTIRFGNGIDEAEGKQIIAEIQQRYPHYRSDGFSPL